MSMVIRSGGRFGGVLGARGRGFFRSGRISLNSNSESLPEMVRRIVAEAAVKAGARTYGGLSDDDVNLSLQRIYHDRMDQAFVNGWVRSDFVIKDRGCGSTEKRPSFVDPAKGRL